MVVNEKLAPFAIGLPNNITCWHFSKKVTADERLHIAMITARARMGEVYTNAEVEKASLSLPERTKRSRRARLAALRRKLGRAER